MEHRTCRTCGNDFLPTTPNQCFCSKRCSKAWHNAKSRGTLDRLGSHEVGAAFSCAHCGKACIPGENVVAHASRFCCRDCKVCFHSGRKSRRTQAQRKQLGTTVGPPRSWIQGQCRECGDSFTRRGKASPFCSKDCGRKARRRRRRAAGRQRIGLAEIGNRDQWTCHLCSDAVDPGLSVPDLYAPTLDHLQPIALGGKHTRDNVALAHMICNSRRGATPLTAAHLPLGTHPHP